MPKSTQISYKTTRKPLRPKPSQTSDSLSQKEPTSGLYYKNFGNIRDPGYFQKPHTLKVGGGKGKGLSIIEKRCIFKDDFARIIYCRQIPIGSF